MIARALAWLGLPYPGRERRDPPPVPPAQRPDDWYGRWPTVCQRCGHRHAGEPCAAHVWRDACPYDAGADCAGSGPPVVHWPSNG